MRVLLVIALLILAARPGFAQETFNLVIDLSNLNAQVDLGEAVKRENKKLLLHRATLGTYMKERDMDKNFGKRLGEARKLGIKFGAYHLLYAQHDIDEEKGTKTKDGVGQAHDFLDQLRKYCRRPIDILLAVDYEEVEKFKYLKSIGKFIPDVELLVQFVREIKRITKRNILVYTYPPGAEKISEYLERNPDQRKHLLRSPLWFSYVPKLEDITRLPDRTAVDALIRPWDNWMIWQYTSGENQDELDEYRKRRSYYATTITKAQLPPLLDVFNGKEEDLEQFFRVNAWRCSANTDKR
jgi:GH25 family lysozyme M1 (1,4-beta-N-acetylmuramidase)